MRRSEAGQKRRGHHGEIHDGGAGLSSDRLMRRLRVVPRKHTSGRPGVIVRAYYEALPQAGWTRQKANAEKSAGWRASRRSRLCPEARSLSPKSPRVVRFARERELVCVTERRKAFPRPLLSGDPEITLRPLLPRCAARRSVAPHVLGVKTESKPRGFGSRDRGGVGEGIRGLFEIRIRIFSNAQQRILRHSGARASEPQMCNCTSGNLDMRWQRDSRSTLSARTLRVPRPRVPE
jgi:hypothetical protein